MTPQAEKPRIRKYAAEAPQFGVAKSLLYSAVLVILFFGCAESALRAWAYFFRAEYERFDVETGTFVLVPGVHRGRIEINSDGFVGAALDAPGPDLWRIVALGDSCTFGGGNSVATYPAKLERRLEAQPPAPGWRFEVVNAGVQGLNSEMALRRLRTKIAPLDPDVVTAYLGWNDLMKFDPVAQEGASRWAPVARTLDRLWLVKGARKLLFLYVRPWVHPPAVGPESRSGRFADFRPAFFEENLRAIVRETRRMAARPALMTLPTVLRQNMTVTDLRENNVVFPYFPSAYGVGDLLDLLEAYNQSIRRVGASERVPVLDLAKIFRDLPDPRPFFYDTMHPDGPGRDKIAEVMQEFLQTQGLLPAEPAPTGRRANR